MAATAEQQKKKVEFAPRVETELGTTEKVKDREGFRLRMNKRNTPARKLREVKKKWGVESKFYYEEMKSTEDELVGLFVEELGISALGGEDILKMFDRYRELRELLIRVRNLDLLREFRVMVGSQEEVDVKNAFDIIQLIEKDAKVLGMVDREDTMLPGITAAEKENILSNIELDPDNDDECDKWVSYILFFSNPGGEWSRLKRKLETTYFRFLDTALVQGMVNNQRFLVNKVIRWKVPECLRNNSEYKKTPVVRADLTFSANKGSTFPEHSEGHRGKLLLLMIRQRYGGMVDICLGQGISATSQSCTGQIKSLYWDQERIPRKRVSSEDEEEKDEDEPEKDSDDEADEEALERALARLRAQEEAEKAIGSKGKKGKRKKRKHQENSATEDQIAKTLNKPKPASTLCAEYELETPLSTAVAIGSLDIVKKLLNAGANPLRCENIAIRAGVKTVIKTEEEGMQPKEGKVMHVLDDAAYIFQTVCKRAQKNLAQSANRGGKVPASNYCTIALLYQAVIEELEAAEIILTRLRRSRSRSTATESNIYTQVLSDFVIDRTLAPEQRQRVPSKTAKSKKTRGLLPMSGSVFGGKAGKKKGKKTVGSVFKNLKDRGRQSISGTSTARSVGSYGTVMSTFEGERLAVKDMNEDLCFILLKVIDRLILEISRPNAATHSRAINGVIRLMERHQLYLDVRRFETLITAVLEAMKYPKAGDQIAVLNFFRNKQVRDFIGFDLDPSWEKYRNVELFIKHSAIQKQLRVGPKSKGRGYPVGETTNSMLVQVLIQAAQIDIPDLIEDFHGGKLHTERDDILIAMVAATASTNNDCIRKLVELYGKPLLDIAFCCALGCSNLEAIQQILQLDKDIQDSEFSLVKNYISKNLFVGEEDHQYDDILRRFGIEPDHPPITIVMQFFFICSEVPRKLILQLLTECFTRTEPIDFLAVATLLSKSSERYQDLITSHQLDQFLATKEAQYDEKPKQIQVNWAQLLLDLYRLASATDEAVVADYNERIVAIIEGHPEFQRYIQESDDEQEEPSNKQRLSRNSLEQSSML